MKSIHFFLLLILPSLGVYGQGSIASLDAKNGFRDMKFGTNVKAYPGVYEPKEYKDLFPSDPMRNYSRKGDMLKLGDVDLKQILYLTHNGRLMRVQLWIEGQYDRTKVLQALKYTYGLPTEEKGISWCSWTGKKVFMTYTQGKKYDGKEYGLVEMNSLIMEADIESQQKAYEKAQLQRAARDF